MKTNHRRKNKEKILTALGHEYRTPYQGGDYSPGSLMSIRLMQAGASPNYWGKVKAGKVIRAIKTMYRKDERLKKNAEIKRQLDWEQNGK